MLIEKVKTSFLGLLFGAGSGSLLILTHNVYPPIGLVASLLGFGAVSYVARGYLKSRLAYLFYFLAVVVLIFIAATPHASEILITGNLEGYLLILGGPVIALLPLLKKAPIK
ncbi:MAG: hypothetical protein WCP54_00755 [Actinomycetes bacterium]|jgi:hypothetical protein